MLINVWLIYKQGEDRVYTSTRQPAQDQVQAFRRDGFQLYRAEVQLPVDVSTTKVEAVASLVPPPFNNPEQVPLVRLQDPG